MAADPLVPARTPFNYNLGINYETWANGRTGRSITADLDAITKNFGLIKTFHDVANPGGANPVIDPDQLQVIKYVAQSKDLQLVMGTYTSALAQGGYGSAWSGPGSMTSAAYTDKWVQMLITSFGSKQAVKDHLSMILLGNEVDQADNHPPNVSQYMGWFRSAFDNLSASLKKAGLGSIAVSTTIAAYTRTDAGAPVAVGATRYIYEHWSSSWNGGNPVVLFNDYTPSNEHGQFASPEFDPVIKYYKSLYTKLGSKLAPYVGETGYSSFYTLENEIRVYDQIKTWLNGQYNNNGRKTIPLFIFNAFDQPSKGGLEQQFGIYADNPSTHRPTGLKPGLTLPLWSRGHIRATSGSDRLYGTSGNDRLSGGVGADLTAGGAGNDAYYVDNAGDRVTESVGEGTDTIFSTVSYALTAGQEVENLRARGTTGLTLTGNELGNRIRGGSGIDTLNAGGGDDRLAGRGGADVMAGGSGNDVYYVDNVDDQVTETTGQGIDKICSTVDYTLADGQDIEYLRAYSAAGLTLTGNGLDNDIAGNSGHDTLNGGGGDDRLSGRGGADVMAGGTGNDVYYVNDPGDQVIEGTGQGTDTVRSIVDYVLGAGQEVENLRVFGTAGLALKGNEFDNSLSGGIGDDTLDGGAGIDVLRGGGGSDVFAFTTSLAAGNIDTIADFSVAADTIRLSHAIFDAIVGTGTLSALQFVANASGTAQDADDRVIYETDTGKLFYDSNGSAVGGAVQFAKLSSGLALTAGDFSIV
ncbi:hypothetical protein [Reyranella sp.]|uniref:hypothetical protein n=1 Tax=Reyranella sp. TaxID=1929291 RepID=UPI003D1445A7